MLGREMACGGDAARSGFESADAAEMGGDPDRAAAVAADSRNRTARGDGGRLTSARAARAVGKIPGVTGFFLQEIVSFVMHQEFGGVRVSEQDSARGFQAADECGVFSGDYAFADEGSGRSRPASDVDAAFYGQGDSLEWTQRFITLDFLLGGQGFGQGGFAIDIGEGA